MFVEQRTYTLHSGNTAEFLRLYEQEGLAIQRPILGRLVGYFSSEVGILHQIIHMWAYNDLEERSRRRATLNADARWKRLHTKGQAFANLSGKQNFHASLIQSVVGR
ncbi:hypothetical protein PsAD2_03732 [Pseudovibrio axinellae]|uniref:NIPSNAP domain-containing protein n=1 Tax=Pseudovibrio axinellae TaxID=989403 RepID=A0A165VPU3_9HYPH|nr:NIPSNAP family protein [Pseudovibrio axinellae]KZL14867.1 hypothetical protein PsAD2_03732 [Pseudovibrio axinellae]SER93908.1 NIPSNAP protein [Pseudovibrio axinellae]